MQRWLLAKIRKLMVLGVDGRQSTAEIQKGRATVRGPAIPDVKPKKLLPGPTLSRGKPMWNVVDGDRGMHVMPVSDLRPHEASPACFCHPTDDEGVWVHNSVDGREHGEAFTAAAC
jgi:hypothetical protein